MVFRKKKPKMKKGDIGKHKFCPVCGTKLETDDNICVKCGYSFESRYKKSKRKKFNWKTLLFIIIIILVFYFSIRYFDGQSIIPTSIQDALNISLTGRS